MDEDSMSDMDAEEMELFIIILRNRIKELIEENNRLVKELNKKNENGR